MGQPAMTTPRAKTGEKPDFDALRAERIRKWDEFVAEMRADGYEVSEHHRHDDACYCACGEGGPCEHDWNGDGYDFPDGSGWSSTCSRCGTIAMHHDMRVMP